MLRYARVREGAGTPPHDSYVDVDGGLMCILVLKMSQEVRPKAVRQEELSKGIFVTDDQTKRRFGTEGEEELHIFNCSVTYYFHIQEDVEYAL
jgi:hypothetical protein